MLSPSLFRSGVVASSVDIYRDFCPQDTQTEWICAQHIVLIELVKNTLLKHFFCGMTSARTSIPAPPVAPALPPAQTAAPTPPMRLLMHAAPAHLPDVRMLIGRARTAMARLREGKGREGRGGRGDGEVRRMRKARGRSQNPVAGHCPPASCAIAACAMPNLLLKHPNETCATYI
jgi:hypothetical protein